MRRSIAGGIFGTPTLAVMSESRVPQMLRAPSIRLFSGEWVGNLDSQRPLSIKSGDPVRNEPGPRMIKQTRIEAGMYRTVANRSKRQGGVEQVDPQDTDPSISCSLRKRTISSGTASNTNLICSSDNKLILFNLQPACNGLCSARDRPLTRRLLTPKPPSQTFG